jgi:hypothetical protein
MATSWTARFRFLAVRKVLKVLAGNDFSHISKHRRRNSCIKPEDLYFEGGYGYLQTHCGSLSGIVNDGQQGPLKRLSQIGEIIIIIIIHTAT